MHRISIWIGAIVVSMICSTSSAQPAAPTAPWVPDLGNGTFKNPVLFADYSDPDVIRVGDDFYLTASSFNCIPGLPILHSKDLVNWKIIGHAIQRMPERFNTVQHSNGIWAPSIRYHDGYFWIFVGDPDWGILMTRTKDPAGEWEPLHVVHEGKGFIDTCPLWDDDGKAYLVHAYANSRAGRKDIIVINEMSPDGRKLIGEEHLIIDGRNNTHPTAEGPKFYKHNGWYYVLYPAGGVTRGWQMAARSRSPLGPYETKRVLEQGTTSINGPHQGGLVELASGQSWFMHFQDRAPYGRIVHLNPVRFVDDWPMMGVDVDGNGVGEPVTTSKKPEVGNAAIAIQDPQTSDEFDGGNKLGLQWQWQANPKAEWISLTDRPGWLRLKAMPRPQGNLRMVPNQLLQKFPAPSFTATTRMEFSPGTRGASAGLIVQGGTYSALMVGAGADGALEIKRITLAGSGQGRGSGGGQGPTSLPSSNEPVEATAAVPKATAIWLRVAVQPEGVCNFSYSTDGRTFILLGSAFNASSGGWMGAKIGLLCIGEGAHADFDWFRVE